MNAVMLLKKNIGKNLRYIRRSKSRIKTKSYCGKSQSRIKEFKIFFFFLFFLLVFLTFFIVEKGSAGILINEVMYDPALNDNYYEWIELYNPTNESINLSGWTITDNSETELIEGDFDHGNGTMIIPPKAYAIITDHGTKLYEIVSIPNETIRLYIDDSSIGNGLGNSGDKLILRNETGEIIDAIEWIIDYDDVPGAPASAVLENHSLCRYHNVDTNDSSEDFYEAITSTPGAENKIDLLPSFDIDLYPEFVPKVKNDSLYSHPFAIKINISNYPANATYQLKSYVIGNLASSLPATQTWNGTAWEYSTYYTSCFTTDSFGNWSGWQYIRFKKDYKEYKENIQENFLANLKVKIKNDTKIEEASKTLYLLDMDDSSSNGTLGGYVTGLLSENDNFLEKKTVIIENEFGNITGIYFTEDNQISEGTAYIPGYYKLTSSVGSKYTIKFLDDDESIIKIISDVTVRQGGYKVGIETNEKKFLVKRNETLQVPLIIKNLGDFTDIVDVNIINVSDGWSANLNTLNINLNPKESGNILLHITCVDTNFINGNITIKSTSRNDLGEFDDITISFKILGPDLTVKDVKIYNEQENETYLFEEGEIIKIKATIKNIGDETANNVNVTFYYDYLNEKHLIDYKFFDSIGDYQKYPSVVWDTNGVSSGIYTIHIIVDEENKVEELSETNNNISIDIKIFKTSLSKNDKEILIVELYYNTHTKIKNEFITLYNPTNESIDISGWYLTKEPYKSKKDQIKIVFPDSTIIASKNYLCFTENASEYFWETGKNADFEYNTDSRPDVPQMLVKKNFTMGNSGAVVALKDSYNHTIDVVVYGKCDYNGTGWIGSPVPVCKNGVLMKRNVDENGTYIDTNTSSDWINSRRYGIGQSNFPFSNIFFYGEIKTFVSPDCSYAIISDELRNAKYCIYLNIYEFTNPFLANELVNALIRNVSVNILLEGSPVGGISNAEKFILNRIANYGGTIRFIINDIENKVHKRYVFNHGKYLVIDNQTVIVESCNWAKTGVPKNPTYGNREWGVVVKNETVADYYLNVFLDDYNIERSDICSIDKMNFIIPDNFYIDESVYKGLYKPIFESETFVGNFSCIPVFSPDTSFRAIYEMIDSASECIYVQQLYIYKNWNDDISPFVERLVNKSKQGVEVKIILNYNPDYEETNEKCNQTKSYFDENGIQTKFIYTNWSIFSNIHNKGMIVDNKSVLISSINWNENSALNNREAGIIINSQELAKYYAEVFFYDWDLGQPKQKTQQEDIISKEHKNTIYIVIIFTLTFALIIHDWRKRQWT
jgi:cardiolipin synthase A/B